MLAAIRPDSWNFPLFLHVFGAMVLMGGLFASALALLRAPFLAGLGFRLLLLVTLPGYILMRVGAQWIASKEGFGGDDDPTWVGIGFLTSDAGALVLLVALILGGIGLRRAGVGLTRSAGVLAIVLLLAYAVSVWAMATKPD
jgi:hypothetical protein